MGAADDFRRLTDEKRRLNSPFALASPRGAPCLSPQARLLPSRPRPLRRPKCSSPRAARSTSSSVISRYASGPARSSHPSLLTLAQKCTDSRKLKRAIRCADTILKKYPDHAGASAAHDLIVSHNSAETLALKGLNLAYMDKKDEAFDHVKRGVKADITGFLSTTPSPPPSLRSPAAQRGRCTVWCTGSTASTPRRRAASRWRCATARRRRTRRSGCSSYASSPSSRSCPATTRAFRYAAASTAPIAAPSAGWAVEPMS